MCRSALDIRLNAEVTALGCHLCCLIEGFGGTEVAALAFDLCGDVSAAFCALYGIALPVAETLTSGEQIRSLINVPARSGIRPRPVP